MYFSGGYAYNGPMSRTKYNPEKRAWRGRSYKKAGWRGGERIRELKDKQERRDAKTQND